MEELLHDLIKRTNSILWSYALMYILLGVGILFTLRLKAMQLRMIPHSIRMLCQSNKNKGNITPFQAFAIGVASRVGTGNIAGVSIALTVGGPGAIFWMWLTAILGMSSAFIEATLAQIFKVKNENGSFRGGPAYYIKLGLKSNFFSILFALSLILAFGFVFNAVQANAIADSFKQSFNIPPAFTGTCLVLLAGPILFGGVRRIAKVTQYLVPFVASLYLLIAFWAILKHYDNILPIIKNIVDSALGFKQAAAGLTGSAISQALMTGIKRGLFSNEAGMGSAPNAAATATTRHPATQGLLQMLGVLIDTIVICSSTAFVILLSGEFIPGGPVEGAALTQRAFTAAVGSWGKPFMSIAIFMFAFSSIIGNYAYAENNIFFILKNTKFISVFRLAVLSTVFCGTIGSLPLIWEMADTSMGLMAIINLGSILLLSKYALIAWKDYVSQKRQKIIEPVFTRKTIPELQNLIAEGVWEDDA